MPDRLAALDEGCAGFDRLLGAPAWPRQIYLQIRDDPARLRTEDDDPIGEKDGFVNAVGDENDSLAIAVPHLHQLDLHHLANLRVERAEGFVHEEIGRGDA